jgi:hypothetical protein
LVIGWIVSTKGWYPSRYEANAIDIVDHVESIQSKVIWPESFTARLNKLGEESNDGYCKTIKARIDQFINEKITA